MTFHIICGLHTTEIPQEGLQFIISLFPESNTIDEYYFEPKRKCDQRSLDRNSTLSRVS